jgi:hypothetical protein
MPDEIIELDCTVVACQFSEGVAGPRLTVIGRRALGLTTEFRDSFVALAVSGDEAVRWKDRIQPGDSISAMCRPTRSTTEFQAMRLPVFRATDLEILYRPAAKPERSQTAAEPKLPEVCRERQGVAAQLRALGLLHTTPVEHVNS